MEIVTLTSLWLPIVVAAVFVFVASSVIHLVLKYHQREYRALPNEDKLLEAMRGEGVQPGSYHFPYSGSMKEMSSPEMIEKYKKGPVGLVNILPSGPPAMGKYLAMWFVQCLVINVFAAYLAGRTLSAGAEYLAVFRVVGTVAFLGHGMGELTNWIWRGQSWGVTIRHLIDGLVYALLTAGVFGWLWP